MNNQQLTGSTLSVDNRGEYSILIDAAPELVFEAWRNPTEFKKWWGPEGSVNQIHALDVRPGGKLRIEMESDKGMNYWQDGTVTEVLYPEKLVFQLRSTDLKGDLSVELNYTILLNQEQEFTRVIVQSVILNGNPAGTTSFPLNPGGWNQALLRLKETTRAIIETETDLNPIADVDREIRSVRIFKASRELVFSLWTDVVHLTKWWGPSGFTITTSVFEFKPGGIWEFIMHGPDGIDYRNKIRYQSIKAPERIEYEHVTGPVHRVIVLFEDCGNETLVHFRMIFATSALRNKVASQFGAVEGLEQTLNRLEELIALKR